MPDNPEKLLQSAQKQLRSQSPEALALALQARAAATEQKNIEQLAAALNLCARAAFNMGDTAQCQVFLDEVAVLADAHTIGTHEGDRLETLGRCNYTQGEYRRASDFWHRCLTLPDEAITADARIRAHIGLGQLYYAHEHYETALAHHRRAEELAGSSEDYHMQAGILINIAVDLIGCRRLDEAQRVLKDALPLVKADQNLEHEAEIYRLLGQIQFIRKEFHHAKMTLMVALKINRLQVNHWGEASTLVDLAQCQLADSHIDLAREQLYSALNLASAIGALHLQGSVHAVLATVCQSMGEAELAQVHRSLHREIRKQLLADSTELETMELRLEWME